MALVDNKTKQPNDVGASLDIEDLLTGGKGITDPVSMVSDKGQQPPNNADGSQQSSLMDFSAQDVTRISPYDFVTKAVPLTALSIVNSFANTPKVVFNLFGGNSKYYDMNSWDWALSQDTEDFYQKHSDGIEAAGLITGSILTDGAVAAGYSKGISAAANRYAAYEAGEVTDTASKLLGMLPGVSKKNLVNDIMVGMQGDTYAAEAGEAAASAPYGGAAFYRDMAAEKSKAIGLGIADDALLNLSMSVVSNAALAGSPLLRDSDASDIADNIFMGTLLGTAFMGTLDGFFTNGAINKARMYADNASKWAEHVADLGQGNFSAGDRIVPALQAIDTLSDTVENPIKYNWLERFKAKQSISANEKIAMDAITSITGDAEVSSGVLDVIKQQMATAKAAGDPNALDSVYSFWANLSGAGRYTDEVAATDTSDLIYLNRFKSDSPHVNDISAYFTPKAGMKVDEDGNLLEELKGVDTSMAYRMPDPTQPPQIAAAGMQIGSTTIANAQQAFDAGYDVFIKYNGQAHVNTKSTRIVAAPRPGENDILPQYLERIYRDTGAIPEGWQGKFRSAPQFIDRATGDVAYEVTPVAGDYGKPILGNDGLSAGEKSWNFGVDVPMDGPDSFVSKLLGLGGATADKLDAVEQNARYVWAKLRGIQPGDSIASTDLPMLEQLYREASESPLPFNSWAEKLKITIRNADDEEGTVPLAEMFYDKNSLLNHIRFEKEDALATLHASGNYNVNEINRILNLSKDGLGAGTPESVIGNVEDSMHPRHLQVQFKLGDIMQQDGNILRGMQNTQYRVNTIVARMDDAVRALGPMTENIIPNLEDLKITKTTADAIVDASGAGFLKQSQGAYGSFRQATEFVGKKVNEAITKWSESVGTALSPSARQLKMPENKMDFQKMSNFVTASRMTSEKWKWLDDAIAQQQFPNLKPGQRVVVLKNALETDAQSGAPLWNSDYIPQGFVKGAMDGSTSTVKGLRNFYVLDQHGAEFLSTHTKYTQMMAKAEKLMYGARGLNRAIDDDIVYIPPINTKEYNHFFIARPKADSLSGTPNYHIVTADSEHALWDKRILLENDYDIYTKGESVDYHKAMGDYDAGRSFYQARTDAAMARKGIINDIIPVTNPDNLIRQFSDFHAQMGSKMVRDSAELANSQLFAELDAMGKKYTAMANSKFGGSMIDKFLDRSKDDPYQQFMDTAVDKSSKDKYTLWNNTNEAFEATFNSAFRKVHDAISEVRMGTKDAADVGAQMERDGLGNPFADAVNGMARFGVANKMPPARYLSNILRLNNALLGAAVIKYDPLQQLLHALSTPILVATEGYRVLSGGVYKELLQTNIPGTNAPVWAISKPVYKAVKNFLNQDLVNPDHLEMYKRVLQNRNLGTEEMMSLKDLAMPYGEKIAESRYGEYASKIKQWISKPFDVTEAFTNFVSADVGRQIFEAQGMTGKELEMNVTSFVNRTKANILTSQRPVAFQGPVGQAVGLFQTYYFNMMQNMFRMVENSETKSLGLLLGLQGTLFGVQGLPGINFINRSIASGADNPGHKDLYSLLPSYMGKDMSDWLLYGSVSNILNTNIYQRSELNPRNLSIIPLNPADWPAVSGTARFWGNIADTFSKVKNGGDIYNSLMQGVEHNGISRPLTGLAEFIQGYSTTSKGSLIALNHPAGQSEMFNAATFARLMGGRPLDEAIILNDMYRRNLYQAKDRARMEALGEAVKSKMISGQELSKEELQDYADRYAALGGNIKNFNSSIMRWHKDATQSVANKVFKHLQDPKAQQSMKVMGGRPLYDYTASSPDNLNQPQQAVADTSPQQA